LNRPAVTHSSGAGYGVNLMLKAFGEGGPLLLDTENEKSRRDALSRLFAGAIARFENPGSHTNRSYEEAIVALEELMLASRLFRRLHEPGRAESPTASASRRREPAFGLVALAYRGHRAAVRRSQMR
jgi:hypothetical protein